MASAEQVPQGRPDNQNDPILRFHRAYAEAIEDARTVAETTRTTGWQKVYGEQQEANRKARSDAAKRLRTYAEQLDAVGWSEEDEKAVKDTVKAAADRRVASANYERDVVERVTEPVQRCQKIIDEAKNHAHREEHNAPLVNVGLVDLMKDAIASVEKVSFDHETGVVSVR